MRPFITILAITALLGATGCSKKEEGPAEQAGKQIDQSIEKAQDYTSQKMDEMGKAVEQTGKDMQK